LLQKAKNCCTEC